MPRNVLVFPAPFGPISVTTEPSWTRRSRAWTAVTPEYDTWSPLTVSSSRANVGLLHLAVVQSLGRRTVEDLATEVHDDQARTDVENPPQVVVDQDHRAATSSLFCHDSTELSRVALSHARCRFVQE